MGNILEALSSTPSSSTGSKTFVVPKTKVRGAFLRIDRRDEGSDVKQLADISLPITADDEEGAAGLKRLQHVLAGVFDKSDGVVTFAMVEFNTGTAEFVPGENAVLNILSLLKVDRGDAPFKGNVVIECLKLYCNISKETPAAKNIGHADLVKLFATHVILIFAMFNVKVKTFGFSSSWTSDDIAAFKNMLKMYQCE
jgi:hypothetical protein